LTTNHSHIIWDWNGTLLDDAWLRVEVMNTLLAERNLPLMTARRYMDVFDFPVKDYYQKLGFDFDHEPFEIAGTAFINRYQARCSECTLRTGALELITALHSAGYDQTILSRYGIKFRKRLDDESW